MITRPTEVLFAPPNEALRFLPEGPYRCGPDQISWVAIQHGSGSRQGSLNLLNLATCENRSLPLPGRIGFAFPTSQAHTFLVGVERMLALVDVRTGQTTPWVEQGIDDAVSGTIINDGVVFDGHLIFGCKDLQFAEAKAGLYLLRRGERQVVQLSSTQTCSNGKAVVAASDGGLWLYDICSPTQKVLRWRLDVERGVIENPRCVVDISGEQVFPDGMILSPDEQSLIVAIYNPQETTAGQARQYNIASGELEAVWVCEGSPRVTCPQLIERGGAVELLLTTADEGMSPVLRARCPNAGCLLAGPTDFTSLNDAPSWPLIA